MKKLFSLFLLTIALGMFSVGCGGGDADPPAEEPAAEEPAAEE